MPTTFPLSFRLAAAALLASLATSLAATRELVQDPNFLHGFHLLAPAPGKAVITGVLPGWEPGPPRWKLAQWSSRFPLTTNPILHEPRLLIFSNAAKTVTLRRLPPSSGTELQLSLSASLEYAGKARQPGQPWVHLLIEQSFTNPPPLTQLERAELSFAARLLLCRKVDTPDYHPSRHAAQFLMYFTVQNLNRQSPGYGQYLWFGVPIYDDRERFPRGHQAPDTGGTRMFIYNPPTTAYTRHSLHDGQWVQFTADLLPLILEGLKTAWQRGFLTESQNLADYHLSGMNLGWEVPGMFDVSAALRALSLQVTPRHP
ncbi:hypothetical protein NXS98_16545 [Fontisphaera persica]|uniref:hypothetical protein n=1 Tax=Fontisphaera persica TaxID=2974023 RepID=UPI0024C0BFD4|nr:hypothetical protein [Fontisphaera persica]WCJ59307.1 hypothetical protein NXS98_16545 [Fontisphaera persica]